MASFFEELWMSIFTPGPTPTLLVATNATFAVLQTLLLALLVATYSIHFVVLSVLCGLLWVSINWFATELRKGAAEAEAAERQEEEKRTKKSKKGDGANDSGTETEEGEAAQKIPASTVRSTGREGQDDLSKRRSFIEVESTDSEWDKVESEVDA